MNKFDKLNVGCNLPKGKYKNELGWVNMDICRYPRVKVQGSGTDLPFRDNSFNRIHCSHVIEHVIRNQYKQFLVEMYRVNTVGGEVYIEVPDLIGVAEDLVHAHKTGNLVKVHEWTTAIYGKSEVPGQAHHWGFTEELLGRVMMEVGYKNITRLTKPEDMISTHYRAVKVLTLRGEKC